MGALGSLWVFFSLITPGVLGELSSGARKYGNSTGAGKTSVPTQRHVGALLDTCLSRTALETSLSPDAEHPHLFWEMDHHHRRLKHLWSLWNVTAALLRGFALSFLIPGLLGIQQELT